MKTMTCRSPGGKCDQALSANCWDQMVKVMTADVLEKHPDVAKEMQKCTATIQSNGAGK